MHSCISLLAGRLRKPWSLSVGDYPLKNNGSHIDASLSRQPLVKGERLVRAEMNAVITVGAAIASYCGLCLLASLARLARSKSLPARPRCCNSSHAPPLTQRHRSPTLLSIKFLPMLGHPRGLQHVHRILVLCNVCPTDWHLAGKPCSHINRN